MKRPRNTQKKRMPAGRALPEKGTPPAKGRPNRSENAPLHGAKKFPLWPGGSAGFKAMPGAIALERQRAQVQFNCRVFQIDRFSVFSKPFARVPFRLLRPGLGKKGPGRGKIRRGQVPLSSSNCSHLLALPRLGAPVRGARSAWHAWAKARGKRAKG